MKHRGLSVALTVFVAAIMVLSGVLILNSSMLKTPVSALSGQSSLASSSVAAKAYSQAELLNMTPTQLANLGVPGVIVGSGPALSTGDSPVASAEAQATYYLSYETAKDFNALGALAQIDRLPISTVEQYQAVVLDPNASFSALYAATLSVEATAASMHIMPDGIPTTDWWIIGGVACGSAVSLIIAILAIGLSGTVIGLALGAGLLFALAAAGAGCALSAAVLTGYFNTVQQVSNQKVYNEGLINKSFSALTNGIVDTQTAANQFYAELPFMQYTLYRLADEAALTQIGNSTFNPVLNLMQSGILQGFADSQFVALIAQLNQQLQLMIAQANTITVGGHPDDTFDWNGIPLINGSDVFGVSGGPLYINAADPNSTILSDYYSPGAGAPTCPLGAGGPETLPTLTPITGTTAGWSVGSTVAKVCTAGPHAALQSFAGDYAGSAAVNGTGGVGSGSGNGMGGSAAYILATDGVPFCPTAGYCPNTGTNNEYTVFPARGAGANGGSLAGFADTLTGNVVNSTLVNTNLVTTAYNDFGALEINAVSNAKAYWTFLRSQGITNPNNVPALYVLVTPAQLLSDGVCVDNVSIYGGTHFTGPCENLNFNQSYSLYLAWLYDLGVINATNYQKVQPVTCASAGDCTFWSNINLYGYGFVYIPGASPQNTSYVTEVFSNTATWAMINTQLLFFPQLLQEDAFTTYNASWEVPVSAPLAVYGTADRLFEPLTGNGTITGTAIPASSPGAAIYLTYCVLYQKNVTAGSGKCVAYPYTVNYTIGLLLCGANTQSCFTTPPPFGSGSCDWFQLQQYLGFAGGLSCALAWLIDILVIIVFAAIIYYVVKWLTKRGPRNMR